MSYELTALEQVENLLSKSPDAREQKNKEHTLRKLLCERYPSIRHVDPGVLRAAITRANSLDRAWRKVMKEKPELRGTDYQENV